MWLVVAIGFGMLLLVPIAALEEKFEWAPKTADRVQQVVVAAILGPIALYLMLTGQG